LARIATGRRMRPRFLILGIALVALLAGTVSPAMGGPTADRAAAGALAKAKRALAIAKQANMRSKIALKKAGTPGPRGPDVPPGARGSEGFDGSDGARGPKGATGPVGPIGPAGAAGLTGATGPTGATGATGASGADGANGADGATGPAGPTASRSVSSGAAVDVASAATVIDLSSNPLAVPFAGRLMATATVQLRNPAADPREARCKLQILNTQDPQAVSDISLTYANDLPGVADFDETVTISGGASKPAGTYNVSLVCFESGGQSLSAERANLQVWAAD
jgi:hypothetical protein